MFGITSTILSRSQKKIGQNPKFFLLYPNQRNFLYRYFKLENNDIYVQKLDIYSLFVHFYVAKVIFCGCAFHAKRNEYISMKIFLNGILMHTESLLFEAFSLFSCFPFSYIFHSIFPVPSKQLWDEQNILNIFTKNREVGFSVFLTSCNFLRIFRMIEYYDKIFWEPTG